MQGRATIPCIGLRAQPAQQQLFDLDTETIVHHAPLDAAVASARVDVTPDLVAARWKQFRAYFADVAPGGSGEGGATLMGGIGSSAAPMNGAVEKYAPVRAVPNPLKANTKNTRLTP